MAKTKAKTTKNKKIDNSEGSTVAGLAILAAGLAIIGIAVMQKYNLKLLKAFISSKIHFSLPPYLLQNHFLNHPNSKVQQTIEDIEIFGCFLGVVALEDVRVFL